MLTTKLNISSGRLYWLKWGLLVFIVALRAWGIWQRDEVHPDEVYSLMLSQCNEHYSQPLAEGNYTGAQLQNLLTESHPLGQDISQLYRDNNDAPHASLYYMMLRTALGGYDRWNVGRLARIGGVLNLIFLIFTYLLIWKIGERVVAWSRRRDNAWTVAAMTAAALLTVGAGECAVLVREYQLAMLFVAWWTWAVLRLFDEGRTAWPVWLGAVCAAVGLLSTGYLNIYYMMFVPLLLSLLTGRWRPLVQSAGVALGGLVLAWGIYLGYFNFMFHSTAHTRLAFSSFTSSMSCAFLRDMNTESLTWPVLLLLLALASVSLQRIHKLGGSIVGVRWRACVAVVIAAVLAIALVQFTSVLREARYSYPYLPMLALAVPLAMAGMGRKAVCWWSGAILLYFCVWGIVNAEPRAWGWHNQRQVLKNGAVLSRLNPNEIDLLLPVVTPGADYKIEQPDTVRYDTRRPTIINFQPKEAPSGYKVQHLVGPLRVVLPPK